MSYPKSAPKFIFFDKKKVRWLWNSDLSTFLTPPHYTNSRSSIISFYYRWFLAQNFSNFVSLPWKLHNQYCHNLLRGPFKFWISGWTFKTALLIVSRILNSESTIFFTKIYLIFVLIFYSGSKKLFSFSTLNFTS